MFRLIDPDGNPVIAGLFVSREAAARHASGSRWRLLPDLPATDAPPLMPEAPPAVAGPLQEALL